MRSRNVEFRLLQLLRNQVGDERQTLAIIHWDGSEMRFAWSRNDIPPTFWKVKRDIIAVLNGVRRATAPFVGTLHLPASIDTVYPVPEGVGSVLVWMPKRVGTTSNPEAHFQELVNALGLVVPGRREDAKGIRRSAMVNQLLGVADSLRAELGDTDRLQTRYRTSGFRDYESPLSWMNGRWHHSFLVNMCGCSPKGVADRFQRALGRLDVSLPDRDIGVMVAVHAPVPAVESELQGIERFVDSSLRDRVSCVRAPLVGGTQVSFEGLRARVKQDVTLSAETH